MSIERKDVFTDEAIGSPLIMAENFDKLAESVEKLLVQLKQSGANIKAADNTAKLTKEVETLTLAQVEQEKITKQLAVAEARQNAEYQQTKKQITELNKEIKTKNELGDMDAKTVTRQNASLKQLEAALAKNREARARLTTEEERSSKTGLELLAIIQSQDKAVKDLKGEMGQHQDKVGDYAGAMKGLKEEFKSAKDEMVVMAERFGTESKEFLLAAEKAGQLKDQIGDLNTAANNVSGSKLENLSSSFGDVFGKLKGGDFGGALESAKQFANVSKSISFAEAGKSLKQFGQTMLTIGKAILTNPMFLIPAVIAGIVAALYKFRDSIPFVSAALDKIGEGFDFLITKAKEFTDWIGLTTFAQDEAAQKSIELSNKQIEAEKKAYDFRIKLQAAYGKETESLEIEKWESVSKIAYDAQQLMIKTANDTGKKLNEDQIKQSDEYSAIVIEAQQELLLIRTKAAVEQAKIQKEANDHIALMLRANQAEANEINTQSLEDQITHYLMGRQVSIDSVAQDLAIIKAFGIDASVLQKQIADRLLKEKAEQNQKKSDQELADEKDLQDALNQLREQAFQTANALISNHFEGEQIELDARKNRLETQQAAELTAAGNNADAKAAIEAKYAAKIKAIENEQRAVKRKQAIADKAMAAFQIGVNTARAITQVLPNIPLSIIMGALGALQLAAVLTKPIPAFEKGVKAGVFKGGAAIVGERGRELINTNQGSFLSPDKATLVNLPKGAEVVTHKETMRRLAAAGIAGERFNNRRVDTVIPMDELLAEQRNSTTEITKAIRSSNSELYLQGSILMKKQKISDTYTKKMMAKHGL